MFPRPSNRQSLVGVRWPVGSQKHFAEQGLGRVFCACSALDSDGAMCESLSRPAIRNMNGGLLSMIGRDGLVVMGCCGGSKASWKGAWSKRESAEWETLLCSAVSVCEDVVVVQGPVSALSDLGRVLGTVDLKPR
jgi:hypothetical protein